MKCEADHFESLGTPFDTSSFDSEFFSLVAVRVWDGFETCTKDPSVVICELLECEEVVQVCLQLNQGLPMSRLIINIFVILVPGKFYFVCTGCL